MNNTQTDPQKKSQTLILAIQNLGHKIIAHDEVRIVFNYLGHPVTYFLSNDWVSGETIKSGKGLAHLLTQIR